MNIVSTLVTTALTLGAIGVVQAQATVKPDGQWRAAFGLGASMSSGNSKGNNLSLSGDGVRATTQDKVSLYGSGQYASSAGTTTAEQMRLGGRYDRNVSTDLFAFGGLDLDRNKFANLQLRSRLSGGLGYHVLKAPDTTFDLFGGLSFTADKYIDPMVVDSRSRSSYSYAGLLLGEESTHKLSDTTSFKQHLVLVPNLKNGGEYLANWDAGLGVSMSKSMSLNVGFSLARNSDPGFGRKTTDTLLTTGLSVKLD